MDQRRRLTAMLEAFEREPEPDRARRALDLVDEIERKAEPSDPAARRDALSARLELLAAVDRHLDPDWDPDEKPVRGAPPPPSHQGPVRGSGEVDPETIADPAERAAYVRTLEERRLHAEWWDAQFQLRRLEERALRFAEHFLTGRYGDPAEARRELDEVLSIVPLGDALAARLRSVVR
jgi:hypothetical protein